MACDLKKGKARKK